MNKLLLIIMLLGFGPLAMAGDRAKHHYVGGQIPVASFVEVDAEFVTVPLTISSSAKSPAERYRLTHNLQRLITDKAKVNPALDISAIAPLQPAFGGPDQAKPAALSTLYISAQIGSSGDPYEAAELVYDFIFGITIPTNTDVKYGELYLSIANPEQFRKNIESQVRDEMNKTLESLGRGYLVKIIGLNEPVKMINRGGIKLAMYIPYKLIYEQKP